MNFSLPSRRAGSRRRVGWLAAALLTLLPAMTACKPPAGTLVWQAAAGNERFIAPPVVEGGTVYVASTGGTLRALDAASGKERWRQPVVGGADLPPLVWRDHLILADNTGIVHAYRRADGKQVWRAAGQEPLQATPVENGGRVYVVSRNRLRALDPRSGRVLWARSVAGSRPAPPTFTALGQVYLGTARAILVFDPRSGRLTRTIPVARESVAPPLLRADRLLNLAGNGLLQVFSLASHAEVWRLDLQGPGILPMREDDSHIYVASGGDVQAVDAATVQWRRRGEGPETLRTPMVIDDYSVYIVTSSQGLIAIDRDAGNTRWAVPVPEGMTTVSLAARDGLVYLGYGRTEPATGGVMALAPADGKLVWQRRVEWGVRATPAAAGQVAYFATMGGELYAVRP